MGDKNQQVQDFADQRIRPLVELMRSLALKLDDTIASIDDVYATLSSDNTWKDTRADGVAHYLSGNDILAINAFMHDVRDAIKNHPQYAIAIKACVRPV